MEHIDSMGKSGILMPKFRSDELSLSMQEKLDEILRKTSHDFWALGPLDAMKTCEIAFRIQPLLFTLSDSVIESILSGLFRAEGCIQFKKADTNTTTAWFYRSATRHSRSYEEYGSEICHSSICIHVNKCRYGLITATEYMNHELNHLFFDAQFLINNYQKPDSFDRIIQLHNSSQFDQATEISAWFWGKLSLAYCLWSWVHECPDYLKFPLPNKGKENISELYSQSAKIGVLLVHSYFRIHNHLADRYGSAHIRHPQLNRYNTLVDSGNDILEYWLRSIYSLFFELIEKPEFIPQLEIFLEKNSNNPEILLAWIIDHSFSS